MRSPIRRRGPAQLLWGALCLATACGSEADRDRSRSHKEEFLAIAQALRDGENAYFGSKQLLETKRRLAVARTTAERVQLQVQLTFELLKRGEVESARAAIDEAWRTVRASNGLASLQGMVAEMRALTFLRLAEVQNCVLAPNAECCIFPLRGGGVHARPEAARTAFESYCWMLKFQPDNLQWRWLANVLALAAGLTADELPESARIPAEAFSSEYPLARFPNIAGELGVDTFNLCGGCIVDDFDGDGFLDIVTSTFDPFSPLTYYRNGGDGGFADRSARSRLDDQLGGLNCIGADYDDDGDCDVFVLRGAWLNQEGRIRNSLLRNEGDGSFTDVTAEAGVAKPAAPTQAAVWGDFDNDGDLDLFVGNESTREYHVQEGDSPSQLFLNQGDGTFVDGAPAAGVTNDRYCKGAAAGDYDNDGDLDLYVSNIGANRLYRNEGDGTFTDVAVELGVTEPAQRSFACWFFDYDNNGWLDLFVVAFDAKIADLAAHCLGRPDDATRPCLYLNDGQGGFENVALQVGLDRPLLPMGANFGDLDNDGWLDVYLGTGDPDYRTLMPNVMLRNDRGQRFQDVTSAGGFGHLQKGHGIAFADLDNDGDQDIYHQLGGFYPGDGFRNALFENPGSANHFLTLELEGTRSNRSAYGARIAVRVRAEEGLRTIHRAVGSVSSFGGSPRRQEIGLGGATAIESLTVVWPASGLEQTFSNVPLDAFLRIVEGASGLKALERPRVTF